MQNTRLNNLFDVFVNRVVGWLRNPWRRISLVTISLLFGNFLATAVSTTTGQTAEIDVLVAIVLTGFTELANWLVYPADRRIKKPSERRALFIEMLNALKLGLIYGMFVEAFKIGS